MAQINFARREIGCKIVYYGPGMCGKTTNLEMVYKKVPENNKGHMTSIATEGDRTLFFDFLPVDLGQIGGMGVKLQLYTVPGQVYYNSTRRLVLQGVDGVVFVADSQSSKEQENSESLANLEENLKSYGLDIGSTPLVIQFNKRDLPDIMDVAKMRTVLNKYNAPDFEAVAFKGEGIFPTLKSISKLVIDKVQNEYLPSSPALSVAKGGVSPALSTAKGGASQPSIDKISVTSSPSAVTVNPSSAKTETMTPASPVPAQSFGSAQNVESVKSSTSPAAPVRVENKPGFSPDKISVSQPISATKTTPPVVSSPVKPSLPAMSGSHQVPTFLSERAVQMVDKKITADPVSASLNSQKAVPPLPKPVHAVKQPVTWSGSGEIKPPSSKLTEPVVRPSVPRPAPDYDKMQLSQKDFPLVWIVVIIAVVVISLICLVVFTR